MDYTNETNSKEFLGKLRDHVTSELKVLRSLLEKAVDEVNQAQLIAAKQNEAVGRIAQQIETLEKTVIRGNGQHGLLTKVALLEQSIKDLESYIQNTLKSEKYLADEIHAEILEKIAELKPLRTDVQDLKIKAGWWGAIAGSIPGIVMLVYLFISKLIG